MANEKFSEYKSGILRSASEAEVEKIAKLFSNDLLEYEPFPDDYLDFFVDILSNNKYFRKKGIFYFVALLGVDAEIMSAKQLISISNSIVDNFQYYEDEMLCLTSCDFIAYYYPKKEAKKILIKLKKIEANKSLKGYADDGLKTLARIKGSE